MGMLGASTGKTYFRIQDFMEEVRIMSKDLPKSLIIEATEEEAGSVFLKTIPVDAEVAVVDSWAEK